MTARTPDDYAHGFLYDLIAHDLTKDRSKQDDLGIIGASSFGCREQIRRTITLTPKTDSPKHMPALLGSYCDAGFKEARKAANSALLVDLELPLELAGLKIIVHPDEVDPDEPSVTDYKAPASLAAIKRGFADERYRRQRHLQYFAAFVNGLVPERGVVRNVFIDRSGKEELPWVEQEPFDMAVVREATAFLEDALYAAEHKEEASKDVPRHVCKDYCPWFTACRGQEVESPLITDPELTRRIAAFHDAREDRKALEALEADLREHLQGLTGETATHRIVSTAHNPTNRASYTKVEVEAL